jgi:hypothetical protein
LLRYVVEVIGLGGAIFRVVVGVSGTIGPSLLSRGPPASFSQAVAWVTPIPVAVHHIEPDSCTILPDSMAVFSLSRRVMFPEAPVQTGLLLEPSKANKIIW